MEYELTHQPTFEESTLTGRDASKALCTEPGPLALSASSSKVNAVSSLLWAAILPTSSWSSVCMCVCMRVCVCVCICVCACVCMCGAVSVWLDTVIAVNKIKYDLNKKRSR
jgi:hypothetical protein